MSRIPALKKARNAAIKEAYAKLESETVNGFGAHKERKYRRDAILAILSKRFYLAMDTISDIVIAADEDEVDKNQIKLFE